MGIRQFPSANLCVRVIDVARNVARAFSLDWVAMRMTYR